MLNVQEFLRNGCLFPLGSADPLGSVDPSHNPDSIFVGWGEWQITSTATNCAIFAPDFYMSDLKPWWRPQNFEVMTREKFASSVLSKIPPEVKGFRWVEPSREGFEKQVSEIRERLTEGQLEKAVPVVHAQALEIMTQDRLAKVVVAAATSPQSLYGYGLWRSGVGEALVEGIVGATPERLFSIVGSTSEFELRTMALAGTRAKTPGGDDAKLLFEDPKERREHQIVVDDLNRELSQLGEVTSSETAVTELPTLYHLKTPISVRLKSSPDFEQIARLLHPTPALGISPRSFGLANMKSWDDTSVRGRFGAPFGLRLKTSQLDIQDCLVAIRNVQWSDSQPPTLGSGCGFVAESVEENEWLELKLKRESVKKVLSL